MMNNSVLYDADGKAIGMLANLHDITDQKLAEEALRSSEEKYRKLVDTSPDAITLVDLQGKFLTANQQSYRQLGYDSLSDLMASGKNAFDFIAPEDQEQAMENMKLTLQDGTVRNVEYKMIRRDGSTFQGELNASLLTDAVGKPTAFIGVTRDVTERRMFEDALRESEERYRKLIEISPDAITMTDLEGDFLHINQQAVRMLGFENAEELQSFYGNSVNAIAEDDRTKAAAQVKDLFQKGHTTNVEFKLVRKDGIIFPVEVSSSVVYDTEGKPLAIIGVARDITERRETEAALRTSETRHRRLIETSPDAILYVNLNRKLITLNTEAADLFGYDSVEDMLIAGLDVTNLIIREDLSRGLEIGKILRASARVENAQFTLVRKDGSTFPGEVSVSMMFDDDGAPEAFIGIVRDITERKKADEQIRRYGEELERLVEERTHKIRELEKQRTESEKLVATGRMAARIAHEINNPLAGIKNSFMLIKDAITADHKYHSYVPLIDKEIDRIAGIVGQMFHLYRPVHMNVQVFKLNDSVDEIIRLLEPICREKKVSIEAKLPVRKGIEVTMPENLLRQVLYNLLLNAIEASPSGKSVILEAKFVKSQLEIKVTDFGKGVLKEDRTRIFEPFFSTKSHLAKPGLGLGLSISKSLIEAMQGEIGFRSTQNKQTVFKVTLPSRISTEEKSDG
jgi:PAS domain S-box-containing protein